MDLDDQVNLEHLLFFDRTCRSCGKTKNLLDDFYISYRDRGSLPSSYSYECKECTIKRIQKSRAKASKLSNKNKVVCESEYPDW